MPSAVALELTPHTSPSEGHFLTPYSLHGLPSPVGLAPVTDADARLATTVADLITPVLTIPPQFLVGAAGELFQKHEALYYVPVVERGQPVGLLCRLSFMNIFLSRYGRELYSRRPVAGFVSEPLCIEQSATLEEASRLITSTTGKRFEHQAFIITHHGQYLGLGWIMDLLEKITDLRLKSARYANPLTLLPGNVPIAEQIDSLLQKAQPFTVAYCDLDHFKPYNDVYGYQCGDQIIRALAEVLTTHVEKEQDFVGHVGGDDFIVIFQCQDWEARCQRILDDFANIVPTYYHGEDRIQCGLWSENRQGEKAFFPLLSLSIGVVQPDVRRCRSHHDVAALATEAKHQAKCQPGNSLFVDRRRSPESMT